jgi:hypothetical protein
MKATRWLWPAVDCWYGMVNPDDLDLVRGGRHDLAIAWWGPDKEGQVQRVS